MRTQLFKILRLEWNPGGDILECFLPVWQKTKRWVGRISFLFLTLSIYLCFIHFLDTIYIDIDPISILLINY